MSTLLDFWPLKREVEAFCVQQAEVAHECVTLSVHQKLTFSRIKEGGSGTVQKASEDDLLSAVLTPSSELTDGFKFIVISGYAGVGKSHYISWINSQLMRIEEANNFHVVWVRKHDTLRTILQSILLPFKDLAEFARILDDLDKAILNNQSNAGYSFQAGMNTAIDHEISNIKYELQALSGDRSKKDEIISKQRQIAFFDSLKFMFNEPFLLEHWTGKTGVFSRILSQVIQGKNFENIEDEEHLFHAKDLISAFSEIDITQLNTAVCNFYQTYLNGSNAEANLDYAVGLLNGLVDKATNFAFQFNQNMGGKSFRDLLGDIRRKLFIQNKELVFLIEDFYAMAGLQEELLPTFIFGGSDQDQICNIRTVLAVTEDFFVNRSTTMSHRKDEFIIDRVVPNKEDQLNSALDMVGAYLNATRVGADKLTGALKEYKNSELHEDWVPTFQSERLTDQESACLDAFGKSPKRSYPLFPFSKQFVVEFLERRAKIDGDLTFSARGIVRNLLLENLSMYRDLFRDGLFPHKTFSQGGNSLNATLENKIQNLRGSEEQKGRLKALIKYWANGDVADSLDPSFGIVADTFKLGDVWKEYESEAGGLPSMPNHKPNVQSKDAPRPPDVETVSPAKSRREVDEAKEKSIEAWGPTAPLTQLYANDLRKHIVTHLTAELNFLDVMNVFGKPGRLKPENIKLPDAAGNNNSAFIDVGTDEGGRLRLVYRAFELASLNKSGREEILYDYPGGFEDRAKISEFIEPLKRVVVERFKNKHLENARQSAQLVPLIGCLGTQKITKKDTEDLSDLVLRTPVYKAIRDWAVKVNEISEHSTEILNQYERVANISQGMVGGKPFCQNLNEIETLSSANDDFTEEFKREHLKFFNTFIELERFDREVQRCVVNQLNLMNDITIFFEGVGLDFENDKKNFKIFLAAIKEYWPGEEFSRSELEAMFDFLGDLNLTELRSQKNKLSSKASDLQKNIQQVSSVNLLNLVRSHYAVSKLGDFFEAVEKSLPDKTADGDNSLLQALQEVETAIVNIEQTLEEA